MSVLRLDCSDGRFECSDITNEQIGISGETVPGGGRLLCSIMPSSEWWF